MTFRTTALMKQTPKIACLPNGPYYLLNDATPAPVPNLRRANGEACATVRGVALCRCGGSKKRQITAVQQSIGVPKRRAEAAKFVREFADDIKASGLVAQTIEKHQVRGVSVVL